MRYAVLLRGVNVGGKNKLPKSDFKKVLEGLGYIDVTTYINSGNAVITALEPVTASTIQNTLEKYFGFTIPTLLLTKAEVNHIADSIPNYFTNDDPTHKAGRKSDVLYLFETINHKGVIESLGYKPDLEEMIYVDKAVIYSVLRKNQLKGSLQKLIGTKLYQQMTVRNVNTARKLKELVNL